MEHGGLMRGRVTLERPRLAMQAMAVEFPAACLMRDGVHPNRMPFEGVLTLVDVASDKAPSGARGHRVMLTRAAAEAALPSLLGMAVDYKAGWDGHDARQKCGIITAAELDGRRLMVAGYLYARDFPEVAARVGGLAGSGANGAIGEGFGAAGGKAGSAGLAKGAMGDAFGGAGGQAGLSGSGKGAMGMSYELADAHVADMRAQIWMLTRVTFTGAAILLREKAAYQATSFRVGRHEGTAAKTETARAAIRR